jgi:hypothetical protein
MAASNDPLALNYDYSRGPVGPANARDLYHFHLLNRPNVVGTAIGVPDSRDEEWPRKPGEAVVAQQEDPRNFENSRCAIIPARRAGAGRNGQ